MAEMWQMLFVFIHSEEVQISNPKGWKRWKLKDFLRDNGSDKRGIDDAFPYILADGWEPYSNSARGYEFRKKFLF